MAIATLDSKILVVQPSGQINASNSLVFESQLESAILSPDYPIVLVDMQQVGTLDSAGLGVLVAALRLSQERNQPFGLYQISDSVRMIFELTQLDRAIQVFDSYEAALETVTASTKLGMRTKAIV